MNVSRLIKRAITGWQSWRSKRRLYRELPALAYFDEAEKAARRSHGKIRDIRKAREAFMRDALAGRG
ncbi:hypothetical protein G9X67_34685 [Rhizobium sp. WYCCWR 11152]|uniref:hypothetical protein n=1 Tax=Rhizobium sp. WYCCWR 11152 TaxID=2692316 RepID=UPI001491EE25|nr:hypothetical protein [Rhizobium sp. WYCCWR 11152]NNU70400.1 hypothetical protein [Rhizobium sp. WYCCWR 11152]